MFCSWHYIAQRSRKNYWRISIYNIDVLRVRARVYVIWVVSSGAKRAYIYRWSLPTQTRNICLKNRHLSYIHIQVTCCWRAFIHWQVTIELLDERDTRYMSPDLSTQWMAVRKAARTAEDTSLEKIRALVRRAVEKERANEAIDLRGIPEAPLLPFSPERWKERKVKEEDSWHTQEDPERTFCSAFRLIILIYSRKRNPTWLCRGGLTLS